MSVDFYPGEWVYCDMCGGSGEHSYFHSGVCPGCKGEGRVPIEPEKEDE